MSVYTQNNKILLNIAGEAYKTAPIIDISSSYGVTKDGSNLVSAVKNRNNASKFRQTVGANQPIENGDGFVFDGTNYLVGPGFDYTRNWQVEFWVKPSNSNDHRFLTFGLSSGFPVYLAFRIKDQKIFYNWNELGQSLGGTTINSQTDIMSPNVYHHVYAQFIENQTHIIVNGKAALSTINLYPTVKYTKNTCIGRILDLSIDNFVGSFNALKVDYNAEYSWRAWDYTSWKRVWQPGQQVFTPPTYPNIIL